MMGGSHTRLSFSPRANAKAEFALSRCRGGCDFWPFLEVDFTKN